MTARTIVVVVVGLASLSGAVACALVAGIDPPTDRAADAAVEGGDATSPGADGGDAASDAGEEPAQADACGGPEICTDGIDNDCNGLTDCADPACVAAGYACVPSFPAKWAYDAIDRTDAAAACPVGYDSGTLVASASGQAADCGCSCSVGTPPDCLTGTLYASVGISSCTAGAQVGFVQDGGQCTTSGPTGTIPTNFGAAPLDAGGTCSANPITSAPPRSETDWRACTGPVGAGCDAGQVCAFAGHPFTACVVGASSAGCPSGYSAQSTLGTGVSDTRGCSGCACAAVPSGVTCENATITFWSNTSCTGTVAGTVSVDGDCHGTSSAAYGSFQYSADAAGTANCGTPTQLPTADGGVSVTGQITACCVP